MYPVDRDQADLDRIQVDMSLKTGREEPEIISHTIISHT